MASIRDQTDPTRDDVDWAGVGLRRTPQRVTILSIVRSAADDPAVEYPTAEWVFRQARRTLPDISLGTVYRTLRILKEKGLIYEFSGGVGPSRYDGARHDHEHVRCICCGTVIDVDLPELARLRELVAARSGYVIGSAPVLFQGVCGRCQGRRRVNQSPTPAEDRDDAERDLAGGPW